MNARRLILTAGLVVAIAGPATQPAGAMIQDGDGGSRAKSVALHELELAKAHQATAIRVGAYNAHAYVRGGASQKVAKAITKAGKRKAQPPSTSHPRPLGEPSVPRVSAGSSGGTSTVVIDPNACLDYGICTAASSSTGQLPQVAPSAGDAAQELLDVSGSSDPYDTSYLYQDC